MTSRTSTRPALPVDVYGVQIAIPPRLEIGHSFFVPALKAQVTFNAIAMGYRPCGYQLTFEERIERGVLGIRVWRVL